MFSDIGHQIDQIFSLPRRLKSNIDYKFNMSSWQRRWWLAWLGLISLSTIGAALAAPVDFAREIQPLLSDKCYHCHGPDELARKGKLRLDTKEGAFRVKEGRMVLKPGQPAESELIRRLHSLDPEVQMPPPDSRRSLTPAQIQLFERWVAEGAKWGQHWAFEAPHPGPLPATVRPTQSPIDTFVQKRLEEQQLNLAPRADPARLLRRISLDLTGLPPTTEELTAFAADNSPAAYEKVVNRLLASPRFGERMAVDWLDLARYADTHGFQADRYRPMWAYRDWVIRSFNRNLPFDQFVTWQLAGDLLPDATQEQRLATAFNRLHLQNEEGGIVEEEFRVAYIVDRVNTFGTTFLGLTFECSRCHDHKYDPLTQKDFYRLFAFFQNIDESGQSSYFTDAMPVPTVLLSTPEQDQKLATLRTALGETAEKLRAAEAAARNEATAWLAQNPPAMDATSVTGAVVHLRFEKPVTNQFVNLANPNSPPASSVENPLVIPGPNGTPDSAIELSGENGVTFKDPTLAFGRADPFSYTVRLRLANHAPRATVLHKAKAWMDAASRGYELVLEDGRAAVGLHHMWPGNAMKVRTKAALATNRWQDVAFTYDGSSRAAGVRIYFDGILQELEVVRDNLWKDIRYGGDEPPLTLGFRMRDHGFKGGSVAELRGFARELTQWEVAALSRPTPVAPTATLGTEHFVQHAADVIRLRDSLHQLRREQSDFINPIPEAMGMVELPQPKRAFVLKRGAYDAPGDEVTADVPGSLPRLPAGQPRNRLGLARWLLMPENPLFARVTVNRLWQQFFGRGLVASADNFGVQGDQPSHPELMDWLALTFSRGSEGTAPWDIKALCRTIVLSETYQQSSRASETAATADPDNRLLSHAPARRLGAEMLRDQALSISGLLVEKVGGASVKPYQPDGLWEAATGGGKYNTGKGEDLYRRSLYTFWKRTVPPPAMTTFDAAERNVCVAKRQSTSTPLQALVLLNDVQMVEAARFLGQRMWREADNNTAARLRFGFRLATGRLPSPRELAILEQMWSEQLSTFEKDPGSAEALLKTGASPIDPALPIPQMAAATVVAQALLNHDESIVRR